MTILQAKELAVVPVLAVLCEFQLTDGRILYWSSMECSFGGQSYEARVLDGERLAWRQTDEITSDGFNNYFIKLADSDGVVAAIVNSGALRGAYAKLFVAIYQGGSVTDRSAVFAGIVDSHIDIDNKAVSITIVNRLNATRSNFPPMRIQKRCSWTFPATAEERIKAAGLGEDDRYSSIFRCGYSPDVELGSGNFSNGAPFTTCDYSRQSCEARGMFSADELGQITARFSGIEFVPASVLVRGHGEATGRISNILSLDARFNDVVPAVYGTAWLQAPVLIARNDGNLTFGEVLLGLGEIEGALKVVVNGYEIPLAVDGRNMTGTGWYRLVSKGNRTGVFNGEFVNGAGNYLGDPYGSLAYLSIAVPNRISEAKGALKVDVLMQGLKIPVLDETGALESYAYSANPAWIICDVLRRTGWKLSELDLDSFRRTAQYCDELISVPDANGNMFQVPRFATNLVLKRRYSVGELLRGIRLASQIQVVLSQDGRIGVRPEVALRTQQPSKPSGSNALTPINDGWPAYEFGDGANGSGGILVNSKREPQFRLYSKAGVDSPNRVGFEIQDSLNEFRQDSISIVDAEDAQFRRIEISQSLPVLGVANFPQALRICQTWLNRSISGNVYAEFRTSLKGIHLRPGDIISISYGRFGLNRALFRVKELVFSSDLCTVQVSCQLHQDSWYSDNTVARYDSTRRFAWGNQGVRAVCGTEIDNGKVEFSATEKWATDSEGRDSIALTIPFVRPSRSGSSRLNAPILSFNYNVTNSGGDLHPGTYFYGISAFDQEGNESHLSTLLQVKIDSSTSTNRVAFEGISPPTGAAGLYLYRGTSPLALVRVNSIVPSSAPVTDAGQFIEAIPAPDDKYNSIQSYWRRETLSPTLATVFSNSEIGNSLLALNVNEWANFKVSIVSGKGLGQERFIQANSSTTLTVDRPWDLIPDSTTRFCIVEASWHRGESAPANQVMVFLPPWAGDIYQVNLRSVSVDQTEMDSLESPLIRWRVGIGGSRFGDAAAPLRPSFGLSLLEGGTLLLSDIAFEAPANLQSVHAASLELWFWDELGSPSGTVLSSGVEPELDQLVLSGVPTGLESGTFLQIGYEILQVTEAELEAGHYLVSRGRFGSSATSHDAGASVFLLNRKTILIPFLPGFLASTAGVGFTYPIRLPNVRVACASLAIHNRVGSSPIGEVNYMALSEGGIRTLSGGQIILSAQGYLAIEASAGNTFVADRLLAVRDIFAIVEEAPVGGDVTLIVRVDGVSYAEFSIAAGLLSSVAVGRFNVAPISAGSKVSFDIVGIPPSGSGSPGRDLTILIRT